MDTLNPYEELGVARDADEATIRRAYRKVSKQAHPDAGGTEEAFAKVTTSLAVLTDPKKRKAFDDTGRIEEDKPDIDGAAAISIIQGQIAGIVNTYMNGFAPALDPRRLDVMARVKAGIQNEIYQGETAMRGGEKVIAFLRDMSTRFKKRAGDIPGTDPITAGFLQQVAQNEEQMNQLRTQVRYHRLALEIVETYDFTQDPAPAYEAGQGQFFAMSAAGLPPGSFERGDIR